MYIKEAHPAEKWANSVEGVGFINEPTSFGERTQVAGQCMANLDVSIPCLIDDMDNTAAKLYKGWPDRLYIVSRAGKLCYVGGAGPYGFNPLEMENTLRMELGLPERRTRPVR